VALAVRAVLPVADDGTAYERNPEQPDYFWTETEVWGIE
jgi:hypothetical protein